MEREHMFTTNIFCLYFYQSFGFSPIISLYFIRSFFSIRVCLFANARSQSRRGGRHFTSCSELALPHANVQKTDCGSIHSYMHAFCKLTFLLSPHLSLLLQLLQQRLLQALEQPPSYSCDTNSPAFGQKTYAGTKSREDEGFSPDSCVGKPRESWLLSISPFLSFS